MLCQVCIPLQKFHMTCSKITCGQIHFTCNRRNFIRDHRNLTCDVGICHVYPIRKHDSSVLLPDNQENLHSQKRKE